MNFKNRTVAFLDILGFKNILKKYKSEVVGSVYQEAISSAIKAADEYYIKFPNIYLSNKECPIYIFSDSIAVFSPDYDSSAHNSDFSGFLMVILYVQRVMQGLISLQFPVRGAIAFGETYLNDQHSIFLGEGYMKAVELEKKQEWIGVSIDKSVEEKFPDFFMSTNLIKEIDVSDGRKIERFSRPEIIRYQVPFKCGHSELLYTVNWLDRFICYNGEMVRIKNIDFINTIEKSMENNDTPEIKKIHENSREYINYINSIYLYEEDRTCHHFITNDKYTKITC